MALTTDEAVEQIMEIMKKLKDMDQVKVVLDQITPDGMIGSGQSEMSFDEYIGRDPDVYQQNGYENREAYLRSLADENGVDLSTVSALADMLGPNEDFDGLVSSLEDMEM
jgi:hypothetical protein